MNRPEIAAVVFDLDGTLIGRDRTLSEVTIEAVERLKGRGITVILATGRSYRAMLPYKRALKLDTPTVNYNGAIAFGDSVDDVLTETLLDDDIARRIIELGREHAIHTHGFRHEQLVFERLSEEAQAYQRQVGFEGTCVDFDSIHPLDLTKLMYMSSDTSTISTIAGILTDEFSSRLQHCYSLPTFYEMMNGKVSKQTALKVILDRLRIDEREVMAFGDGHNDIPMLTATAVGVAMGNSSDEVKRAVAYQALSNDEDGVARFLNDYFSLGLSLG